MLIRNRQASVRWNNALRLVKIVAIALLIESSNCLENQEVLNRVKRAQDDSKFSQILERIDAIETTLALQRYLPKCTAAISEDDLIGASKNWAQITAHIGNSSTSVETLEDSIQEIITDSYKGKLERMNTLLKFVEKNIAPKSALLEKTYQYLLQELDDYGQFICRTMPTAGLIVGVPSHTFRTIKTIKDSVGVESTVFQSLPRSSQSILLGKEVTLQNRQTGAYLYLHYNDGCDGMTAEECSLPRVVTSDNFPKKRDERFIWKLSPVESKWKDGLELFYIDNPTGTKMIGVRSGDGSLTVRNVNEEHRRSSWAMFYVHMVNNEDDIIVQCSYWGLKTLALNSNDTVTPKLKDPATLKPLEEEKAAIWKIQAWNSEA